MFKLLALRVLDGCADHIKKCLHSNVYYYFCSDYRFDIDGKVYKGSRYSLPLPENFFSLPKTDGIGNDIVQSPIININAIVGKNGDGKSTIVEIIIRLVNNYISTKQRINKQFLGNRDLLFVSNLHAELFFLHGHTIYKLYSNGRNKCGILKLVDIDAFSTDTEIKYIEMEVKQIESNILKSIYTFVSNYSHYAYNIFDFQLEWNRKLPKETEDEQNEACWLYHVFHKNDGYITPLALHPYRKSGNIDINREKSLSEQRLMSLFINANDKPFSFRNVLDKKAVALRFSDPMKSKLQEITLKQFLNTTWTEDNCLDKAIDAIEELKHIKINSLNYASILKNLQSGTLIHIQHFLDILTGLGNSTDKQYSKFMAQMNEYVRKNIPQCFAHVKHDQYQKQQSNIARYIHDLHHIQLYLKRMNIPYNSTEPYLQTRIMLNRYSRFVAYNVNQLARIRLIYQVACHYGIDPYIIFENYEDLSEYQKCQHYIIYKTISILHKYPDYTSLIKTNRPYKDGPFEVTETELMEIFKQIEKDRADESHITRKLDQALTYTNNDANRHSDYYAERLRHMDYAPSPNTSKSANHSFLIELNTLRGRKKRLRLQELPPPIYEYEIIFEQDEHVLTGMNVLSSGEKQLLNTIGAFIYQIRNIDSAKKYDSINLILEEIELYFHPEYQRLIIQHLIKQIHGAELKKIKNINITFVTHSPFVLSDIPKCNVLFLKDGLPDYQMQENTFGANIHSLLKNGFFLPNLPIGEFAYQKINELFRQLNGYDYSRSRENIANLERLIAIIGEPYLREQLYKLLRMR